MDHSKSVSIWSFFFLSRFRDGGEKKKGGGGVVYIPRCFILYQHLSLNLFPPCLAVVSAETQQEKVIGSQTFLGTFHCKYWEHTRIQSRLGATGSSASIMQTKEAAIICASACPWAARWLPLASMPQEPHLEVTKRWTSCCCTAYLSSSHYLGEEKSYFYSPQ